jgi:MFS family permease
VLSHYRAVFREPGTAAFCAAAFVMRMPIAMYPLGLVLIVSSRTGHYGFAGFLSGCYVLGGVPGNPLLARLADRFGQRRVALPATAVHVASGVVMIVLFQAHAADWSLVAPTLVFGFSYISVVSLVRARWSYVLSGRPELGTAFSLESILDEIVFIVGPLFATVVATQLDPVLVLVIGVVLVGSGAAWLCSLTSTEPPVHPRPAEGGASALRVRGMVLLTLSTTAMGGIFAGAEVSIVAFCGQHGLRAASGGILACFAFGSATAGFVYGARHWRRAVADRYGLQASVFAVLPALFLIAWNVPVLAPCTFVVGLGIAPAVITAFGVAERIVPVAMLNEGMAWVTTGINLGYGIAAALVGRLADAYGARPSFGVAIGAGLLMGLAAVLLVRRLRRPASQPVPVGV